MWRSARASVASRLLRRPVPATRSIIPTRMMADAAESRTEKTAYDEAVATARKWLAAESRENTVSSALQNSQLGGLVAGCMDSKEHDAFRRAAADGGPTVEQLSKSEAQRYFFCHRFFREEMPFLMADALNMQLVGDVFPHEIQPRLALNVSFPKAGPFLRGERLSPSTCLDSPEILLVRDPVAAEQDGLVTLMLVDVDAPRPGEQVLGEWCHWMVVNVPLGACAQIGSVPSPFLSKNGSGGAVENAGTTIFPYVPPHPNKSNPTSTRRVVLLVLDQGQKALDAEAVKAQVSNLDSTDVDGPPELEIVQRGAHEKAWQWLSENLAAPAPERPHQTAGLLPSILRDTPVAAFAFFRTSWDHQTPAVFSALKRHEAVYGEPPRNPRRFFSAVDRIREKVRRQAIPPSGSLSDSPRASVLRVDGATHRLDLPVTPLKSKPALATSLDVAISRARRTAGVSGPIGSAAREKQMGIVGAVALVKSKQSEKPALGVLERAHRRRAPRYH